MTLPSDKQSNVLTGIKWMVMLTWCNRILGFLSVFILARLLTPEQFGVVAVLMIALQLADTLTQVGSEQYYIQHESPDDAVLNSAWSINLIVKLSASVLMLILAPSLAAYFSMTELIPSFMVVSCIPFITASANGWLYRLKRELNLQPVFKISILSKVIANTLAIIFAWVYQSYWALILGAAAAAILNTVFSYVLIGSKARFSISYWREQLMFSKWVVMNGLLGHVRSKMDTWFVISFTGIKDIGGYNLTKDVALLPSKELINPISDTFFSAIGREKNGSQDQHRYIRICFLIVSLICIPTGVGWFLIADSFIPLVLGEQWHDYISILEVLGGLVITFSIGHVISQILVGTGHVKPLFYYDLTTLVMSLLGFFLIVWLVPAYSNYKLDIGLFAVTRVILGAGTVIVGTIWLSRLSVVTIVSIVRPMAFILFAAIVMSFFALNLQVSDLGYTAKLFSTLIISAVTFLLMIGVGCKLRLLGNEESDWILQFIKQRSLALKTGTRSTNVRDARER